MTALRALLAESVDYAGLFPPAGLPIREAIRNYAGYLRSEHSWMLGRFVLPVKRLGEAEHFGDSDWRIAAIGSESIDADVNAISLFNARNQHAVIDTLERKVSTLEDIRDAPGLTVFYELPLDGNLKRLLEKISDVRGCAKIRTGGLTPQDFPEATLVARFIHECVAAKVPFKATAGLHHALRGEYPVTYERDSPRCMMHGFLNVFSASLSVAAGASFDETVRLLEAPLPDRLQLTDEEIRELRAQSIISFGSCSFEEPIQELSALL